MATLKIKYDDKTSHAGIMKQVINGLVEAKWASRKELETELVAVVQSGVYMETKS